MYNTVYGFNDTCVTLWEGTIAIHFMSIYKQFFYVYTNNYEKMLYSWVQVVAIEAELFY